MPLGWMLYTSIVKLNCEFDLSKYREIQLRLLKCHCLDPNSQISIEVRDCDGTDLKKEFSSHNQLPTL